MAFYTQSSLRVFSADDDSLSLTIKDGVVVIAPTDPADKYQHWIKDTRHSSEVKDEEGFPAFALVNKGSGEALKHSEENQPVGLVKYNPGVLDESVLWTKTEDTGDGYRFIRKLRDVSLVFDAESGGKTAGARLILYKRKPDESGNGNQRWKMVLFTVPDTIYRVQCLDALFSSLAVLDGLAIMVQDDSYDENQQWLKDTRYSYMVDKDGNAGFALINKITNKALQHVKVGDENHLLLIEYDSSKLDESTLWTEGPVDLTYGYLQIRSFNYPDVIFLINRNPDNSVNGVPLTVGQDNSTKGTWWKITARS